MVFNEDELSAKAKEVLAGLESMHQSELQGMASAADDDTDLIERMKGSLLAHTKFVAIQLGLLAKVCDVSPKTHVETCKVLAQYIAHNSMMTRVAADVQFALDDIVARGKRDSENKGADDGNETAH
jgi:hypothetical protein